MWPHLFFTQFPNLGKLRPARVVDWTFTPRVSLQLPSPNTIHIKVFIRLQISLLLTPTSFFCTRTEIVFPSLSLFLKKTLRKQFELALRQTVLQTNPRQESGVTSFRNEMASRRENPVELHATLNMSSKNLRERTVFRKSYAFSPRYEREESVSFSN